MILFCGWVLYLVASTYLPDTSLSDFFDLHSLFDERSKMQAEGTISCVNLFMIYYLSPL